MKKFVLLLLLCYNVSAQKNEILTDTSMFLAITKQETLLQADPSFTKDAIKTLPYRTSIALISYAKPFWMVMRDSTVGYVHELYVSIADDVNSYLKSRGKDGESVRITSARKTAELISMIEREEQLKVLKSYEKKGFIVTSWSFSDHSEYSEAIDTSFEIFNPTKKTIKYVWFTLTAYNPVRDIVGKPKIVKAIGPVKPYESAGWDFEYVFFSNVIDCMRISRIKVQYMDGTFKEYPNPNLIMGEGEVNNCGKLK